MMKEIKIIHWDSTSFRTKLDFRSIIIKKKLDREGIHKIKSPGKKQASIHLQTLKTETL